MDLRALIHLTRQEGLLVEVDQPANPDLEMAAVIRQYDGRPVLFSDVTGYPGWRVAAGMASAREHFALSLGTTADQLLFRLVEALANPTAPEVVAGAPCQEVVEPDVDLARLPILRHLPSDGGRYITAGVLILADPDYGPNVSFHRMLQLDGTNLSARVVEGRGTDTALKKSSAAIPVAICIGNDLSLLLAASMSAPAGVDELQVANALIPLQVVRCQTVPLYVPAHCEVVLEGYLTHETAPEGPFVDLTETMDVVRQGPIVRVQHITHRRDPIYQALLPGKLEHRLLMGMPKEPSILAAVNEVCRGINVAITPGGTSWLHAVVQIDKQAPEDGRRAVEAAFRGHGSLKHVVVVDRDVDPFDMAQVEWAIATRFQADRDLVVLSDQPGSSLDPSAQHEPGKKTRTAKMGLDATIPWGRDRDLFARVAYD
jgi:2,5-furandicarboxylate decarboxylase 1